MDILKIFLILGLLSSHIVCLNGKRSAPATQVNVLKHGAKGDGKTDDSKAFLKAWNVACNAKEDTQVLVVPFEKKYLLHPIMFTGPCKPKKINFLILGKIIAPKKPKLWKNLDASQWLGFKDVSGLHVYGKGVIDGQGQGWWDQSCRYHPDLKGCTKLAPTSLKFLSCNNTSLSKIRFNNSPQTHVLTQGCYGIDIDRVVIKSPGDSPNTDGIHIHACHSIQITNSIIGSGDDCVSIGDYTSDVYIHNVTCGPGHGISIGSLGRGGNVVQVENILVTNCSLHNTTNGARIKTWQVGKGDVRNITFEDIKLDNVEYPMIIDQYYCDVAGACPEMKTGVKVTDVTYKGISGTSSTEVAVNLNCTKFVPCSGIKMENIQLTSAKPEKQVVSKCANAFGLEGGVAPGPCLSSQQVTSAFKKA